MRASIGGYSGFFHGGEREMRRAFTIGAAAAIIVCAAMLVSCSTDDTEARYSAYYKKCQEYTTLYGSPEVASDGSSPSAARYGKGLCVVKLLDMDADGKDELILMHSEGPSNALAGAVEVFSYRKGEVVCDYSGSIHSDSTNGWLPFVVLDKLQSGGGALMNQTCFGSAPATFTYTLVGYNNDGAFGPIAGRASGPSADFTFSDSSTWGERLYTFSEGDGSAWTPADWQEVSQEEYDATFDSIVTGETTVNLLYQFESDGGREGAISLADTIDEARATISKLAEAV